ncbi:MFS transporter [Virgisporangium ochraceum]|uniref:MFS transporter n=1 Tax=Virgisporangium ochraceum TaxID=65505 RepID=UPI001EF2E723
MSDAYGFMVAGLVITMGTLGDRIGRRRLLLARGAAFGVLSVAGAFASGPLMLIVVRALIGVAGATLMPSTLALITNMFRDDPDRGLG